MNLHVAAKLHAAARVLGVELHQLTENALALAFKRAVRLAHPDTGGGGSDASNINRAQEARDVLRVYLNVPPLCQLCRGSGIVNISGSFTQMKCICQRPR